MDIRKTAIMMCAATCIGTTTLFAQIERKVPSPGKEHFKAMPLSPEKRAKRIVNQMDSLLNLTQKQYDKLYKSYLKHEKQVEKNRRQGAMPPMMVCLLSYPCSVALYVHRSHLWLSSTILLPFHSDLIGF